MSIFLLMVPVPHKFGDEAFDLLHGQAARVEVGDGLARGELLGKRDALRNVGLQDGRVERRQRVANIAPNNSISYYTINNNYLFNVFFKALCLSDKVHSLGGRPDVRRRWLHGDKDQIGSQDDGLRQVVDAWRTVDDDVGVVGSDRR